MIVVLIFRLIIFSWACLCYAVPKSKLCQCNYYCIESTTHAHACIPICLHIQMPFYSPINAWRSFNEWTKCKSFWNTVSISVVVVRQRKQTKRTCTCNSNTVTQRDAHTHTQTNRVRLRCERNTWKMLALLSNVKWKLLIICRLLTVIRSSFALLMDWAWRSTYLNALWEYMEERTFLLMNFASFWCVRWKGAL